MTTTMPGAGALLREWRQRRRLSQLDLALAADTSARHLSYVETGRSSPSRAMVLRLCETLEVPLRERNTMLLAAGYAPEYRESGLDDPDLAAVRSTLDAILAAHEPFPAVVVDRHWNVVLANHAMGVLTNGTPDHLNTPEPNVYRLVLHPEGLIQHLVNPHQIRTHFLETLSRQVGETGDAQLRALLAEVSAYPHPLDPDPQPMDSGPFAVPMRIRTPGGTLSLFSTMAIFGAPADITLSELAIELFYPLDDFTATTLRGFASS